MLKLKNRLKNLSLSKSKIPIRVFRSPKNLGINYTFKLAALMGVQAQNFSVELLKKRTRRYLDLNAIILRHGYLLDKYEQDLLYKKQLLIRDSFYKGIRYKLALPVRGQRTHTNASTARRLLKKIQ